MKTTMLFILTVLVTGALSLSACTVGSRPATQPAGPASPMTAVSGTVTYRQRIALPPSAVIEVMLADVSRQDVAAEVISTQRIEANGKQVPFPYELPYDPAKIDPRFTYAVSARITDGSQLLFISMQQYPVITNGNPTSNVEVVVEPAS